MGIVSSGCRQESPFEASPSGRAARLRGLELQLAPDPGGCRWGSVQLRTRKATTHAKVPSGWITARRLAPRSGNSRLCHLVEEANPASCHGINVCLSEARGSGAKKVGFIDEGQDAVRDGVLVRLGAQGAPVARPEPASATQKPPGLEL